MKLSVKVQDQHQNHPNHIHHQNPLLLRAKIPVTVFGLPFLSVFAASDHPSDLSLSLRTNFSSGPSLKLSYASTPTTTTPPLTLTLKSGVSLSGSPNNSPLIISAHFAFSPQNPNPIPTFSLQFKPQFGDFSLRKTTVSNPNPNPKVNGVVNSIGFVPLERPMAWKDLTMESATKYSILSGIAVMAKTAMPVTNRVALNFRWGVNFPAEFGKQLPILSVNKIGIERIDEVKEVKRLKEKNTESNEVEMLKGMYSWMRREVDVLQKENREMKHKLEEMKLGQSVRNSHVYSNGVGKKSSPSVENDGGFEKWRNKKSGEENGQRESKKNVNSTSDVESELQRAIKAASSK